MRILDEKGLSGIFKRFLDLTFFGGIAIITGLPFLLKWYHGHTRHGFHNCRLLRTYNGGGVQAGGDGQVGERPDHMMQRRIDTTLYGPGRELWL